MMPISPANVITMFTLVHLILCPALISAAPLDPAKIPADTKWLLHFDVEKARNWTPMQKWQQQMESKEWYQEKAEEMIEIYGWNPVENLQGISMYDNEYSRNNGVLALHVRNINVDTIANRFKRMHPNATSSKYRDRMISTWTVSSLYQGEHLVSGCLVNNRLMLISNDPKKIKASIDVIDGRSPAVENSAPLLESFNQEALIACRAIDIPQKFQSQTKWPALLRCQSATMFFSADNTAMNLKYDLEANNDELASKMKGAMTGMWAMMKMKIGKDKRIKEMLDAVQITREDNHLIIAWQGKTADIETFSQAMKGKRWKKFDWKEGQKQSQKSQKKKSGKRKEDSEKEFNEWIKNFQL